MAFNEIYTSWTITNLPKDSSLATKLELLCRGARTLALRAAIANRLDTHQAETGVREGESVEIYLYYETHFEARLLTAIKTTKYGDSMGRRSWIDTDQLGKEMEENYLDYLIELPAFTKLLENDESFKLGLEDLREKMGEELAKCSKLENEQFQIVRANELKIQFEQEKKRRIGEWIAKERIAISH